MTEPLPEDATRQIKRAKLAVRRELIGLSSQLKAGVTTQLLSQKMNEISKCHAWDSLQLSVSVDERKLERQENWEFCEGEVITLELVVVHFKVQIVDSITLPVGQIKMDQVDRLRFLWANNRIEPIGSNFILIGMPGTGKSTVGKRLAERLSYSFYDLDELIQSDSGRSLEEIIYKVGYEQFLDLEAEAALKFAKEKSVLATGGSVIYRPSAMLSLQNQGTIIYLETPIEELRKRLSDLKQRGVVLDESQSLEDLYKLREPFYESYHDLKIDTTHLTIDQTIDQIIIQTSRR